MIEKVRERIKDRQGGTGKEENGRKSERQKRGKTERKKQLTGTTERRDKQKEER